MNHQTQKKEGGEPAPAVLSVIFTDLDGRVPKRIKGTDCKSVIRRFESDLGLLSFLREARSEQTVDGRALELRISG
jgi:hypothetical protein